VKNTVRITQHTITAVCHFNSDNKNGQIKRRQNLICPNFLFHKSRINPTRDTNVNNTLPPGGEERQLTPSRYILF